jgi:hypothetical protein
VKSALAHAPRRWPRWLSITVPVLALAAILSVGPLLASLPNREVDLTWQGTLRDPGGSGLTPGARCLLRVRPNVQFHEVLVGEWRVSVRCGGRSLFASEEACCLDQKATECALEQTRRLGAGWYAVQCHQPGVDIDSKARRAQIRDARIDLDPESAPLLDDPLFEQDGRHLGFRNYATPD